MQTTGSLGGGSQGGDDLPELLSVSDTDSDDESVLDVSALTEGKLPDMLDKRGTVSVLYCSSSRAYSPSR